jgi:hypothetical protein
MRSRSISLHDVDGFPHEVGDLADPVRMEMMERGFTLVPTPLSLETRAFLESRTSRFVKPFDGRPWRPLPALSEYARWLEELLRTALPDEPVALAALELRHERAGSSDASADRLHVDGSYIRSVYTHHGPATIYRDGKTEQCVPAGRTLLMTAMNRARSIGQPCTLHRRPGPGPERAVIVCSFEPTPEHRPQSDARPHAGRKARAKAERRWR